MSNTNWDLNGLYQFLSGTPEGGLRKMLVDGKPVTDVHFGLLMKVIKACKESDFAEHAGKETYPTVRFSPNESKLKEIFWRDCFKTFQARGLLQPGQKTSAAA